MTIREFEVSRAEMGQILKEETIGYPGLSVDGQPYVVPLNYGYVEGRILFHCTEMTGRREREKGRTYWRYTFEP